MEIDYKVVHVDKAYRYISAPDWKSWRDTKPVADYTTWCKDNLPYVVETANRLHLRPETNLIVCNWIRDVCHGHWARSATGVDRVNYMFELRNDALMFKLKWG